MNNKCSLHERNTTDINSRNCLACMRIEFESRSIKVQKATNDFWEPIIERTYQIMKGLGIIKDEETKEVKKDNRTDSR